jgi:hypothetical protein
VGFASKVRPPQSSTTVDRTKQAEQSQEWGSTAGISSIEEHNEGERHNQTPPFVSPLAVSCLHRETHTHTYPCPHHSMTYAHVVRWSFVVAFHTSKVSAMPFGFSGSSGSRVRWVVRPVRTTQGTLDLMRKRKHIAQSKWTADERQSFADGVRLRASTVPDARKAKSKRACRLWHESKASRSSRTRSPEV